MPSNEDWARWFENPLIFLWSYFILVTIILTFEHCRIRFEPFDEFCICIENAIASFFGFSRASICGYEADTASGDQEDDSNRKLRENAFAEKHEEVSPIAPKRRATTSITVKPRKPIDEIHPNKMFSVRSMDKKIITSNAEESISCEEREGNRKENNAMLSETRKLKLWKSLDQHVVPDSELTLKCPRVSLDEQSLLKQMFLPELSADVDIDVGNVIADSKNILKKSGPSIEHKRRCFIRSVSFAESVSILPNIETTDNTNETDPKGIECNFEQSDASNFRDDISLDDPIPVSESNSGSKTPDKNQEQQENTERKLDINSNAKLLLRRSLSLDPWPKPSKKKIFKKMERCLLEEVDEEFRLKKRSLKHETKLTACTEEYDREFSEAGNSFIQEVGENDSVMDEIIDN